MVYWGVEGPPDILACKTLFTDQALSFLLAEWPRLHSWCQKDTPAASPETPTAALVYFWAPRSKDAAERGSGTECE
ncbi:hypothetical protein RHIZ404_210163 [Rhizobium sp. EC-SD404]|nr:hypothetical protein RHIZ404_210163 [Rhizobium sp. EC-SD404]